jgi:hypothetical protein
MALTPKKIRKMINQQYLNEYEEEEEEEEEV